MACGYRLNVEDIFFRMADASFAVAKEGMGEVYDVDPKGMPRPFKGPISDDAAASAVLAVVGWAVGIESFVNQAWNARMDQRFPTVTLFEKVMKSPSTVEKAQELIATRQGYTGQKPAWLGHLRRLFELRNRFAHYKARVGYQGFEFAPPELRALQEDSLQQLRRAAGDAIMDLAQDCPSLRTGFLKGGYRISYDLEAPPSDPYASSDQKRLEPDVSKPSVDVTRSPPSFEQLLERLPDLTSIISSELRGVILRPRTDELFSTAATDLHPAGANLIAAIGAALAGLCNGVPVLVEAHTDSRGSRAANTRLTVSRAEAVKTALAGAGLDATHVEARGFGPDMPICSNASVEGRNRNRRVEIVVLGSSSADASVL